MPPTRPFAHQLAAVLAGAIALGVVLVLFGYAAGLAWRAFKLGAGW